VFSACRECSDSSPDIVRTDLKRAMTGFGRSFQREGTVPLEAVALKEEGTHPAADHKYFYLYFPDWIANGTPHTTKTTQVSVARASSDSVLDAAFGSHHPQTVAFQSSTSTGGTCNPPSGEHPPTLIQNPHSRDISTFTTTARSSAT
jgi:hypothetical protein